MRLQNRLGSAGAKSLFHHPRKQVRDRLTLTLARHRPPLHATVVPLAVTLERVVVPADVTLFEQSILFNPVRQQQNLR